MAQPFRPFLPANVTPIPSDRPTVRLSDCPTVRLSDCPTAAGSDLDTAAVDSYFPWVLNTSQKTDTEHLLAELIALPSVNPAFAPAGSGHAGEQRVADFLASRCALLGLPVEFQKVFPDRANLLTRLEPQGKVRHRVLLAPHLDTVGAPQLEEELFHPVFKRGRIYGRGACDTKGSVAAMLSALFRVARSGPRPKSTAIHFAGFVDEENGQAGSRAFAERAFRSDLAIVGEPTCLRVVTAHKGDVWLRLETKGTAAHGARPELGRNAVHAMARVVECIETEYAAALKRRRHPILGNGTVNVGSISGGTQPNIVPDHCFITVDRRTLPGETEAQVRRELTGLLRRHRLQVAFASARTAPCLALETSVDLPLVRQFLALVGQSGPVGVDYFCDAAVLAQGGIPSVVFGPGDIAQAHTADEWIERESLNRATDLLESFLRALP